MAKNATRCDNGNRNYVLELEAMLQKYIRFCHCHSAQAGEELLTSRLLGRMLVLYSAQAATCSLIECCFARPLKLVSSAACTALQTQTVDTSTNFPWRNTCTATIPCVLLQLAMANQRIWPTQPRIRAAHWTRRRVASTLLSPSTGTCDGHPAWF